VKVGVALMLLLALPAGANAQDFAYRGFFEVRSVVYPRAAPRDDDRASVEGRVRLDPAYKPAAWLTLSGSLEARLDSLQQVERRGRLDWLDREAYRPLVAVRQAAATVRRGRLAVDAGKQFIRWGKADILSPTDRFAPRDFLEVTDSEFLAVTGARVQYEMNAHLLDLVWVPFFTPSRTPLFHRRWASIPAAGPIDIVDRGAIVPGRSQAGARWRFVGSSFEASLSYFDGLNHLPEVIAQPLSGSQSTLVIRTYLPLKMTGLDAAWPLAWFTIKGEAALLKTPSSQADEVVLYVVQLERMVGGWRGRFSAARSTQSTPTAIW
jgi:hypothetical protein